MLDLVLQQAFFYSYHILQVPLYKLYYVISLLYQVICDHH